MARRMTSLLLSFSQRTRASSSARSSESSRIGNMGSRESAISPKWIHDISINGQGKSLQIHIPARLHAFRGARGAYLVAKKNSRPKRTDNTALNLSQNRRLFGEECAGVRKESSQCFSCRRAHRHASAANVPPIRIATPRPPASGEPISPYRIPSLHSGQGIRAPQPR
jgi:hypothetical protein